MALFIVWAVFVFSFFGKFLFLLLLLLDRCSSCRHRLLTGRLNLDSDGPDEADQFAPYCGDDLALVLARRRQPGIALGEPDLCFQGNLFDWFWNPFLSLAQPGPDGRPVPITPGGFDDDASQMCVACLGDASALLSLPAGVLAGNRAAVTHQRECAKLWAGVISGDEMDNQTGI